MYDANGKKMLNICILEILKKYTDCDHTLDQKDIMKKLESDYGMVCDRKSVKANLMALVDFGFDINCTETERKRKNGEVELLTTGWYYNHEFDEAELRMLIDSILFSKTIPTNQAQDLIDKITNLGNDYFSAKVKHVCNLPNLDHTDNKQIMYNVELIDEAIGKNKKIAFVYNTYGVDKKLHPRRKEKYIANPYQMVANNSRYYLICNYDKYDNIVNCRVDRMTEVTILEDDRKPKEKVHGMEHGLNLPKLMAEHVYMFSDNPETIVLKAHKNYMGDMVDLFGKNFDVLSEDFAKKNYNYNSGQEPDMVFLRINCSKKAMFHVAMQYGEALTVITPADLRDNIRNTISDMLERYKN